MKTKSKFRTSLHLYLSKNAAEILGMSYPILTKRLPDFRAQNESYTYLVVLINYLFIHNY